MMNEFDYLLVNPVKRDRDNECLNINPYCNKLSPAEILLLQATYKKAIYEVYNGADTIRLAIGEGCSELDRLISARTYPGWALITAYNPYSQSLSTVENQQRHQQLLEYLERLQLTSLAAIGRDKDNVWTPEVSLLVLGLKRSMAIAIGRQFQQNAIVYGKLHQPAELLWVNS